MALRDKRERPHRDLPDVEIAASARAKSLRFEEVPETEVDFPGGSEISSRSTSERRNLPEEVEAEVTYRDIEVRWSAGARFERRKG